MLKYDGLWEAPIRFDHSSFVRDFDENVEASSTPILANNAAWKSKSVYKAGDDISRLPVCFQEIFIKFGQENIKAIGYFNLDKGASLHRHRDMHGNLLFGVVRIHIPIKTNPSAFMFVGNKRYHLPLGTAWVLDTSQVHALENSGDDNRVHLVIDVTRAPETEALFPKGMNVKLHLAYFILILCGLLVRDVFIRPKSILKRIQNLTGNKSDR